MAKFNQQIEAVITSLKSKGYSINRIARIIYLDDDHTNSREVQSLVNQGFITKQKKKK